LSSAGKKTAIGWSLRFLRSLYAFVALAGKPAIISCKNMSRHKTNNQPVTQRHGLLRPTIYCR